MRDVIYPSEVNSSYACATVITLTFSLSARIRFEGSLSPV